MKKLLIVVAVSFLAQCSNQDLTIKPVVDFIFDLYTDKSSAPEFSNLAIDKIITTIKNPEKEELFWRETAKDMQKRKIISTFSGTPEEKTAVLDSLINEQKRLEFIITLAPAKTNIKTALKNLYPKEAEVTEAIQSFSNFNDEEKAALIHYFYTDILGSYSRTNEQKHATITIFTALKPDVSDQETQEIDSIQQAALIWYEDLFESKIVDPNQSIISQNYLNKFIEQHKQTLNNENCYVKPLEIDHVIKNFLIGFHDIITGSPGGAVMKKHSLFYSDAEETAATLKAMSDSLLRYKLVKPNFFAHIFEKFLYYMISDGYVFNAKYTMDKDKILFPSKKEFLRRVDLMIKYFCDNNYCKAYERYKWLITAWTLKDFTQEQLKRLNSSSGLKGNYRGTGIVLGDLSTNGIRYGFNSLDRSRLVTDNLFHMDPTIRKQYGEFLNSYLYYKCHPVRWWSTRVGIPVIMFGALAVLYKKSFLETILQKIKVLKNNKLKLLKK